MRIELKTDGGLAYFPGLSKPFSIDSDALPAPEAKQLQQLVTNAQLLARPNTKPAKNSALLMPFD